MEYRSAGLANGTTMLWLQASITEAGMAYWWLSVTTVMKASIQIEIRKLSTSIAQQAVFSAWLYVWIWVYAGARECSVWQILVLSGRRNCRSGPVGLIDVTARFELLVSNRSSFIGH